MTAFHRSTQKSVTPEIFRRMELLRGEGKTIGAIAGITGFSFHTVKYHLDKEYKARHRILKSALRAHSKRESVQHIRIPLKEPLRWRDLTAILCGDPAIGRSALDRRTEEENGKNSESGDLAGSGEGALGHELSDLQFRLACEDISAHQSRGLVGDSSGEEARGE